MILRLHNLCWRHEISCQRVLTPPQSLTYRKLFGLYFHSCMAHSAQLLRVASHRSTNAEMFEQLFEKLSDITTKTWSKRIEDLSTNAILHLQAVKFNPAKQHVVRREKSARWQNPFPNWITPCYQSLTLTSMLVPGLLT